MKKFILLIVLLTLMSYFAGCWDYTEYNQMTQIYSIGIDYEKESKKVILTLQYIPISKSGDTNQGTVYSASDITLIGALTKLQQASPNKLFFGYLQVIVIGEAAAKDIMKDIIVFFDRTPIIRNSVNIVVVPGKAEGTIATRDPNSVISSGQKIRMLLSSAQSNGNTHSITQHDFVQRMVKSGIEPIAPRIITTSPSDDPGKALGGKQNGVRFAVEKEGNILAAGVAAFKKERFVGWLDDKETLGLNWILGNRINSYKTADTEEPASSDGDAPSSEAGLEKVLHFYITKSGSKIKVKIKDGKAVINIKVKVEAALRKYYSGEGNEYITPEIVDSIEKKLEKSIYSDIMAALDKGKEELDSDIFGFGFSLYRQNPRKWHKEYEESWEDMFSDADVNVNVEATVNNTGTNIKRLIIK